MVFWNKCEILSALWVNVFLHSSYFKTLLVTLTRALYTSFLNPYTRLVCKLRAASLDAEIKNPLSAMFLRPPCPVSAHPEEIKRQKYQ